MFIYVCIVLSIGFVNSVFDNLFRDLYAYFVIYLFRNVCVSAVVWLWIYFVISLFIYFCLSVCLSFVCVSICVCLALFLAEFIY